MGQAFEKSQRDSAGGGLIVNTTITMILYFLITATMQNLVLTAGFDASLLVKLVRQPRQLLRFGVLLLLFSTATSALFFPLDILLPDVWWANMLRPLVLLTVTGILYIVAIAVLHAFPEQKRRCRHLLPLAAFNNIVVGIGLLINYKIPASFFGAIGLSAGSAIGFLLVAIITAETVERMDNPDIPAAFRGLPATLVYMGLLALALMGFAPAFTLV